MGGKGCVSSSCRDGHSLLCKQCNAAKEAKRKHALAPASKPPGSRPPAAIGKRSAKKGHVCEVKK